MNFLVSLLMFAGLVLAVIGLIEVVRKVRWGNVFTPGGVSDVWEVTRLQELNRKIRDDVTETVANSKNCFQIFKILAGTRFRNMPDPTVSVLKNDTWKRSRDQALTAAKRGYRDSERFLRISMDSSILLLREAFAYGIHVCMDCPLFQGRAEELKCCPVTETLKTEARTQ